MKAEDARRPAHGARHRFGQPLHAFAEVFRNPDLRRLQLAWSGYISGE